MSPGLEAVVLKALDKDPDLRYQSARELLVDLERLARGVTTSPSGTSAPATRPRRSLLLAGLAVASAVVLFALGSWLLHPARPPRITQVTRIAGGLGRPPTATWATDGVRLYFVGPKPGAPSAPALFQVPATGGEPAVIPLPFTMIHGIFGYAEGESALLMVAAEVLGPSDLLQGPPLWLVPVPNGTPRRLGNLTGWFAALSPDGERVVAFQTSGLVVARRDGSEFRRLGAGAVSRGRLLRWSPDGQKLRVQAAGPDGSTLWIWEMPLDGGAARPLWPGDDGGWTGDGRYFVLRRNEVDGDLYAVRESATWPWRRPEPVRLTFGPLRFEAPGSSPDGGRLFAWGTIERQHLRRYDAAARRFVPHLGGASVSQVAASPDGQWLVWVQMPDRTLWRGRADGTDRRQLTGLPLVTQHPRWSPDGRRIVFTAGPPGGFKTLRVIAADGGEPELLAGWPGGLLEGAQADLWDPCWLPDGRTVLFSTLLPWQPGIFRVNVETREVSRLPGTDDLQLPKCGSRGQVLAMVRSRTQFHAGFRVLWPGRTEWEDVGLIPGAAYVNWSRDGQSIIGLNGAEQRIERRSLRTGRVEVLADVRDLRLDTVGGGAWMGLGPDDLLLVVEDLSTSDLYALDWEAP